MSSAGQACRSCLLEAAQSLPVYPVEETATWKSSQLNLFPARRIPENQIFTPRQRHFVPVERWVAHFSTRCTTLRAIEIHALPSRPPGGMGGWAVLFTLVAIRLDLETARNFTDKLVPNYCVGTANLYIFSLFSLNLQLRNAVGKPPSMPRKHHRLNRVRYQLTTRAALFLHTDHYGAARRPIPRQGPVHKCQSSRCYLVG